VGELGSQYCSENKAVCAIPEDRTSRVDVALWCLAGVMALVFFLLAPHLRADNTGRVITVVISVAIFACSIHPTLHSPWLYSNISRRIVLCFAAVGIAAFGWILWPYSLNVSPTNVRFADRDAAGPTYSFRFTNRSDKDLYASQLKFRIHSRTLFGKDFLLNIPTASRKAYGEGVVGARRFADIQGFLCHDSYQRPLFSIFVFHLAPHESREITITSSSAGIAKVGATTGLFSTTPQPLNVNGKVDSPPFRSDEALSDCRSFGFLVDAHEHEGMYWFNHEDGKLDGMIVPPRSYPPPKQQHSEYDYEILVGSSRVPLRLP
jgi:hypothetical protein